MRIGMILDNEFVNDPRPLNEARFLIKHGFEVFVLCYNHDNSKPPLESFEGIQLCRINLSKNKANKLFALKNLIPSFDRIWEKNILHFVKTNKIDCLHVHDLYMAEAGIKANKKLRLPLILDLHENFPAAVKAYHWASSSPNKYLVRPNDYKKKEFKLLYNADKIIVLSDEFAGELCGKYPLLNKNNFITYPNVPDIDILDSYSIDKNILDRSDDDLILFYFGIVAERRGVYTCFEALKSLKESIPNIKLLIIGPVDKKEQKRFQSFLDDKDLKGHIIYHQWQDISLLPSFIKASDICLSPLVKNEQHESGVANKIFQYMLFEKPLIVSDCTPQKNIVNEHECGLSFKAENAEDLEEKVLKLFNDNALMLKMGANGKKAVHEKYNVNHYGQNLVKMYQKVQEK